MAGYVGPYVSTLYVRKLQIFTWIQYEAAKTIFKWHEMRIRCQPQNLFTFHFVALINNARNVS